MSGVNHPLCVIQILSGQLKGKTFPVHKPVVTLGRDSNNDIVIFDPKVSRHHARLLWENGNWSIEKVAQRNTLTVNRRSMVRSVLQNGDTIGLGEDTACLFLLAEADAQAQVTPQRVGPDQRVGSGPVTPPIMQPSGPISSVPMPAVVSPTPPPPLNRPIAEKTAIGGMPALIVSSNVGADKQTHPLLKPMISIGRHQSNDIVIGEPVISNIHAQIVREGDQWVFVHPHPARDKTLNGLIYQGNFIPGNQQFRKPLVRGDIFRIGDMHGTLVTLAYDDGSGALQEPAPDIHPIALDRPLITLGRAPDNMVVLNHPLVSAHHAQLIQVQTPGGYRIVDLNSTNHVYVNGQAVTGYLLNARDEIRIGPFRFIYTGTELTQHDESRSIRIDAIELKKAGNNKVILLNDISLVIPPRKFVAVVGGSGAGKSTLMDALNGLRPAQQGTVLYNGQDYYRNLAAFSAQLGYVPQDDIVHRDLTVYRALYYAARMRLPNDFTEEQIAQRIHEVLEDVEMSERRDLLVSKLSGGQRKRVSIALELLANPSVFFLDEPTSGLDPGLDRKMMFLLRRLADRGRTIVLVTHATNNINTCDYVCFLAQGGRLAYFGPPEEARVFFNKSDFAEIYSSLEPTKENPHIPLEAEARFKTSPDFLKYVAQPLREGAMTQPQNQQPPPAKKTLHFGTAWKQFILLSMRYLELLKNDRGNLLILLLQAPVIALLLVVMVHFEINSDVFQSDKIVQCRTQILTSTGPVALPQASQSETIGCDKVIDFLKNDTAGSAYASGHGGTQKALQDFIMPGPGADAQKVLFIMAFGTVLFGCINGAREIVKEGHIYRRERAVNLRILPYMFSKIVVLGILSLLQSLILIVIVDLGVPLHQGVFLPVIPEVYITLALTSLAGLMVGLTVSAIAPNNDRAMSFVPIILIPQVIFSGTLIPLKDWFTQIFATIFPTRWAMAALGSSLGLHADKIGEDHLFGSDPTYHGTLFSTYSSSDATARILLAWLALAVIIVVLMLLIALFLKQKDKRA